VTTATDLLAQLQSRGIRAYRDGADLVLEGDATDEEIEAARTLKRDLLDLLPLTTAEAQAAARDHALYESRAWRSAWAGAVLEFGALAGFPCLPFAPARSVAPSEFAWRLFTTRASVEDLMHVVSAVRDYLGRLPLPEPDVIPAVPSSPTLSDGTPANACADCGQPCGTATRCSPCAAERVREWREGR